VENGDGAFGEETMNKSRWVWMPHAGHFILGHKCRFHLTTYVGGYIVSTIGECPEVMGVDNDEFKELGSGPETYETMVFTAVKREDKCCPYKIDPSDSVACERYMTADEATEGHMKYCKNWAKKEVKD